MNELARKVWMMQDGKSVHNLASMLGITPSEVRAAYDEAFEANKKAKANGKSIPYENRYSWPPEKAKKVWEMHCAGMSATQIGVEMGIGRTTVSNKIKKMKGQYEGGISAFRTWTPEEDEQLLVMRREGKTHREIAKALGRTTNSVNSRSGKLAAKGVY